MFRLLFILNVAASAATLTLNPAAMFDCTQGFGTTTVTWSGASGPVQVLIGPPPAGVAFTALTGPAGQAATGPWVSDGLTFYLVDQSGAVQASAVAHVNCAGTPRTIDQGLAGGSYFPLAVGNTWVYKINERLVTADYIVWSITNTQIIAGQTYYALTLMSPGPEETLQFLRADAGGVIWQYDPGGDKIFLDPGTALKTSYSGPLGIFKDAVQPPVIPGLGETTYIYARGLGLANSQSVLLSGSSGGFSGSMDLIDARVDGVHLSVPAPKLGLSVESTDYDLTHKLAPNCAIPCYFAACSIAGADPVGTYRPCAQARIDSTAPAQLQLLDPNGNVVYQTTTNAGLDYVRLPLYTGQLVLLPSGDYKLVGTTPGNTCALTVHIH